MDIILLCHIFALVCFLIATVNPPWPRPNLVALGLAFWVVTLIVK